MFYAARDDRSIYEMEGRRMTNIFPRVSETVAPRYGLKRNANSAISYCAANVKAFPTAAHCLMNDDDDDDTNVY